MVGKLSDPTNKLHQKLIETVYDKSTRLVGYSGFNRFKKANNNKK